MHITLSKTTENKLHNKTNLYGPRTCDLECSLLLSIIGSKHSAFLYKIKISYTKGKMKICKKQIKQKTILTTYTICNTDNNNQKNIF